MAGGSLRPRNRGQTLLRKHHVPSQASLALTLLPQNEQEGVDLANLSKYGLGAGIWTSDLSRAHRVSAAIDSGLCWVNTHHRNDPSSPW